MTKLLVGLIFSLFLINNAFSLEVDFSCPDSVFVGEEFECSLQAENFTGVYDAKVDISVNKKNIAEVWDDGWKSAYYYLYEFVDSEDEKKIKLKIVGDYEGEIDGILKLRKEGEREFFDFVINVESNEEALAKESNGEKENYEEEVYINEKNKEINKSNNYSEINEIINLGEPHKENNIEPESIKTTQNIIYESKNEKIKKYSVLGFALLCVMLSVLIIMNKL